MAVKVVYDYQAFVGFRHSGISRYFAEVASSLSRSDLFEVRLFAMGYLCELINTCIERRCVVGFERPRVPKTTKVTFALNSIAFRVWARSFAPEVVHETYFAPRREAPPRSRVVLTVYDFILEKFPSPLRKDIVERLIAVKSRAIRRADHLICISENTRADLMERFDLPGEKVSVIHLGSSLRAVGDRDFGALLPEIGRRPFILFVGSRGYWKNFERLVRAFASSEALKRDFTLVSFGLTPFTQVERNLFSEVGLNEFHIVHLVGDDDVLAYLYRHAACFVYPSIYEGFGIPPLEAMSFDCPVVCSNSSSMPEVAGDAAEYFDPSEVDGIRGAIERVLYATERAKELVLRGRERTRQFSWERCAEQTGRVYQSLL